MSLMPLTTLEQTPPSTRTWSNMSTTIMCLSTTLRTTAVRELELLGLTRTTGMIFLIASRVKTERLLEFKSRVLTNIPLLLLILAQEASGEFRPMPWSGQMDSRNPVQITLLTDLPVEAQGIMDMTDQHLIKEQTDMWPGQGWEKT